MKKSKNYLRGLRVLLAILFFVPILFFFVDFAGKMSGAFSFLPKLQIVPAILSVSIAVIVVQLVVVLIFGRIYCSTLCPAGVLQDIINRVFCIGRKKKNGLHRFKYHKALNWVRYPLLALTAILTVCGVDELLLLLDPYSNFGRISANLFRPAVMWTNNILAALLVKLNNYSLFEVTISTATTAGIIAAVTVLLLLIVLVIFRGRFFCNTLCPVGGLLSLFSRFSIFKISFDQDACTHCGSCEHSCKAEAIDSENLHIDTSRCVDCFDCVSSCPKGGLKYRLLPAMNKKKTQKAEVTDTSRRNFIATTAVVAASLPIAKTFAAGKDIHNDWPPITPPGSISIDRFKDLCTGCGLCVSRCPSQVLRPAGTQFGFDYLLKPYLSYANSFCNYSCTICSEVCPTDAIKPLTIEKKKTTQVGIAQFYRGRCVVYRQETSCGACSEHCPTQAVHMVPYKGYLTIPEVDPKLCIGCGGCESICPARPRRAIQVKPNAIHKTAVKPIEIKQKEIKVDDFGF